MTATCVYTRETPPTDSWTQAFHRSHIQLLHYPCIQTRAHPMNAQELKILAQLPDSYDGILFTSPQAAFFLKQNCLDHQKMDWFDTLLKKPIFAVGPSTAQIIRRMGAKNVLHPPMFSAAQLAQLLADLKKDAHWLWIKGLHSLETLESELKKYRHRIDSLSIYETGRPQNMHPLVKRPHAVVFFSPSAVDNFGQLNDLTGLRCYSIGPSTSSALAKRGVTDYVEAMQASSSALLTVILQTWK